MTLSTNQSSLKAGHRGPTLLEDFILREKITHFDHERIPERVVHARGSGAHGYFECTKAIPDLTKASLFAKAGKRTPLFAHFSTVAGNKGSADTVRDTRGFSIKFYTDEGNWDFVGNNIPVFFIQDAIKFPDVIHAIKPEQHHNMPQASSAHDTFYDFISLMPESLHHLFWVLSDHGLVRSYRTMQGFGIHTFRLVNAAGKSSFVKFHWQPEQGTHSCVWDEASRIAGADPDYHRRDLWEAIETGNFPSWELQLQVFSEEQANELDFDVLDATKLIPEELVPLQTVGRMVLNRNPDNFFCETEQVAFCPSHVVPGIDFSNDPMLQGRLHSYLDTQLTRLGGPNFHEIPINQPLAQVHNNHRGGLHRHTINRGRVSYEPNSLGGGCPFQAGVASGFASFPEMVQGEKLRVKPDSFRDHYSQTRLFYRSQTEVEKKHIIDAFRFELTRVAVPTIRTRMLSHFVNVDAHLAQEVAKGLGMEVPPAAPMACERMSNPGVETSPSLSLFYRQGLAAKSLAGRRIALLVDDGVDLGPIKLAAQALAKAGAMGRIVGGSRLGAVKSKDGSTAVIEATVEAMPTVLWDAVVIPGGKPEMSKDMTMMDFIKAQYKHGKPILAMPGTSGILESACIAAKLKDGSPDPGVIVADDDASVGDAIAHFQKAVALHRHFQRELQGMTA